MQYNLLLLKPANNLDSLTYFQNIRMKIHGAEDRIISIRQSRTK